MTSVDLADPVVEQTRPRSQSLVAIAALGFVASVMVVIGGSMAGASAPNGSGRLWSVPAIPVAPRGDIVPALVAYYGGLIVLVRAWLLLRRHHLTNGLAVPAVVLVVLLWAGPLLVGPPLGSRDVYAYAAQGRLADQGFDVYQEGPAQLGADDPVLAPVDPLYREAPVVYGPVFVALSSAVSALVGDQVVIAVLAFRLMAVAGLTAAAIAVHDIARGFKRDPVDALILAVANPLVLLHLVSGAHNEAIMLGFLVGGVAIGRRRPLLGVGIALCAFAAAIKLPAILAVAFLGWPWVIEARSLALRAARLVLVAAEALLVIAAAGRLTGYGWGWVDAITNSQPVDAYLSVTRVLGGGVSIVTGFDVDAVVSVARLGGMLLAGGVSALLLFRRHASWPTALAWSLLLWAVMHPTTQPWYLTWGLMLLAATSAGERNRGLVAGCVAAMFVVLPIGPQLGLVVLDDTGGLTLAAAALLLCILTFSPQGAVEGNRRGDLDSDVVSIIVPTRHESDNVEPLVQAIETAVVAQDGRRPGHNSPTKHQRRYEILFVDDSDDDTPQVIERTAATLRARGDEGGGLIDVTLVHRSVEHRWGGLGGAVVDGMAAARGSVAVVMDGDMQHPPSIVPSLVAGIDSGADVAVASRRIPGGSDGMGLTPARRLLSSAAAGLARAMFPSTVGRVADPMSGFFAVALGRVDLDRLQPDGFKILVEVVASHPRLLVVERPFRFAGRVSGISKASPSEGTRFLGHLVDLRIRTTRVWGGAPVPQRAFPSVVRNT
jgi:hypothetical protein